MAANRLLIGLIGVGIVSYIFIGCSAHIRPQPKFSWPEMADSKISGKLALYISPAVAKSIARPLPADDLKHKDLIIGPAAAKLVQQACISVFQEVIIFDKLPNIEQLKTAGFRGIFRLDSIITIINMPRSSINGDSTVYTDISVRLGLSCSAEDFLIKRDVPPVFGPDGQYGKKFNRKEINAIDKILKDLSERILKESGQNIAQSLVNIYGARP